MALFVGSDNTIELRHLVDIDGDFITDATVTVTLTDSGDTEVSGETWPLTMSHVSSGTYRATLIDTLSLTAGLTYTATVTATKNGDKAEWAFPQVAATRVT